MEAFSLVNSAEAAKEYTEHIEEFNEILLKSSGRNAVIQIIPKYVARTFQTSVSSYSFPAKNILRNVVKRNMII